MFRILLLLSLFVFSLNAQPIKAIQFNGLIHLSQSTAIDMVGLEIGDEPDPLMINNAIKAFFEQRYFEDIWVTHNDGVLTFHFKEKPIISKVDVEGLGDDEEETSGIVNIRKGALYDEKLVEAAKERIISHVNAKGKIDTVVDVEKEQLENGSVELKFVVNKGEDIIIKDIYFKGRKAFDQDELEGVTANRAEEFMGWLWGRNDGEIQLEELSRDNLRIQDLYMQHGYMDAKVEQPFTRIDFNQYTAKIQYKIDEGKPYEVSDVIVSDASGALNIEKLRQIVHMNSGERFNIKTFRDDMTRLKKYVADQGYAYVRINPDMDKDKYNGKVAVTFNVVPGEKVYIRNVEIGGNTRTLDRVIRRELYLAPGHLYSLTDLEDSKTSLGRTGYFESSTIEEKRVSANEIDLVVKVKESPTGSISVGGGYGSYEGFLLSASLSDRNLFGSGLSGSLQFDNSSVNNQQSISITNPHLNDSVYSVSASIYNNKFEYIDYTVKNTGGSLGVGRKLTRFLRASLGYAYVDSQLSDVNSSSTTDSIFYQDSYKKSSFSFGLSYDNTDDYYVPRHGIVLSDTIEYAGIGGTVEMLKNTFRFSYYKGLEEALDYDLILRYNLKVAGINDEGFVPVNERLFMGGVGSVRGYESYSISPRDSSDKRIGGFAMLTTSIAASVPLIPEAKLRGALFYDYGTMGTTWFNDIQRSSTGFAVEWFSPMGPIQLIFAKPLDDKANDRLAKFEFTIGQRF